MIQSIKNFISGFFKRAAVQSVLRHAVIAAIGVFAAAITVGGFQSVTVAVVVAAAAAALRVVWLAVAAYFGQ